MAVITLTLLQYTFGPSRAISYPCFRHPSHSSSEDALDLSPES